MGQRTDRSAMPTPDPWMTLPQAVSHSNVSERELRRHYSKPESDPAHLKAVKQLGKIKIRQSWLDDWMTRTSEAV